MAAVAGHVSPVPCSTPSGMATRAAIPPPPTAVALSAFRALPDGSGRQYTATTFPKDPWQGCEHMIRMARHVGYVLPSCSKVCGHYAVLDVLTEDGDIVHDYCIPNAKAFRWWYRKLHLRIEEAS